MPTDTLQQYRHTQALNFALRGVAWSLGLFGLMRVGWVETHAVLPLTLLQARVAASGFGTPALPIEVTLACSGADALALCAGAILAYPATWPMRLRGAGGGIVLILALNTVRIGALGRAAAAPVWFDALHVFVWPALLTVAIAGYVFTWMRVADTRHHGSPQRRLRSQRAASESAGSASSAVNPSPLTGRFVWLTAVFLVLFSAASSLYLESAAVLAVAAFVARAAAVTLRLIGIDARATANVLSTARGGFLVTQECITTPLIPVYVAAAFAYSTTWRPRVLALLAAVPLFVGLGVARLLVVALPAALIGSPLFLIHAFYQLLLAAVVVGLAAFWRHGAGATAWRRAMLGGAVGAAIVYLVGPLYARTLASAFAGGAPLEDPQGALAFLPAFQVGLYVALSVAACLVFDWRRLLAGLGLLGLSQIALFAALHVVIRHAGVVPHVRDVRAWALAGPLLIVVAMVTYDRPRR